jgi:hypothetical protein
MRDHKLTQKQLAQLVGKSPAHVSDRLRLRKLPDASQRLLAAGRLPLTVVRSLIHIARTSAAVADACARLVADGDAEADDLATEPHHVVSQVLDVDWPDAPFLHACRSYSSTPVRFRGQIDEADVVRLAARAEALGVTRLAFTSDDIDAARAFGCLLEFEGSYASQQYVTDARFTFDRLTLALDTAEATQTAHTPPDADRHAVGEDDGHVEGDDALERARRLEHQRQQARQAARAKEREQQERRRVAAIGANRRLGLALAKKLGSKELDRDTAQLLARLVLRSQRDLAARGIRLTHAEYHELEHVRNKNGSTRTRFTVIDSHAADAQLREWVLRPKQPGEIVGRLLQALVAGTFADHDAIAKTHHAHWSLHPNDTPTIAKLASKLLPDHFAPRLQRLLPSKPKRPAAKPATRKQGDDAN